MIIREVVPVRRSIRVSSLRLAGLAVLLAPFVVAQLVAGQQTPRDAQQPVPIFRTEANYVEVDVRVTDARGNFVRDLSRDDFEVLEDGKRQQIATFGLVDLPYRVRPSLSPLPSIRIEPDVRSNTAVSEGRVFVIVLDDLHTHALRSARVKEAARQFIERYVGPDDLVAVIHTSGRSDSQDFTSNSSLMLASVDKFMGRKLRSSTLARLEEYQRQRDASMETRADLRMQRVFDPLDIERGRQAENMLETLQRLGDLLADTRGRRKSVVLIGEGIDYEIQNAVAQTNSGLTTFTSSYADSVRSRLRQAIGAMTRANVAIYGIDPRGIATGGDDLIEVGSFPENPLLGLSPNSFRDEIQRAQDSLRVLSEETGGVAAVSSNDLTNAFDRIMRDNSTYYVLAYRSNNTRTDGRFRKIDVRVKRPGVQVRARRGYLAPSSREPAAGITTVMAGMEPSVVLRQALNNPLPLNGVPLHAFAAPFKGAGANGSVLFGLEVDARNFRFEQADGLYINKLEAAVVAINEQGKFLEGDRHTVELRLKPETHQAVRAKGMRLLFRLNLPKGRYQLRAALHETGSGAVGSVHYDVQVPDFGGEALSVSGLVLTSTSAAAIPTPRPDPDLMALLRDPPTGSRGFTPAETLAVAFALYHDPTKPVGSVDVATTVADEDGRVRFNSELKVSDADLRAAPNGYGYVVEIPLGDMTPGTYVLRVQAKSRLADGVTAVRELPFRIHSAESPVR